MDYAMMVSLDGMSVFAPEHLRCLKALGEQFGMKLVFISLCPEHQEQVKAHFSRLTIAHGSASNKNILLTGVPTAFLNVVHFGDRPHTSTFHYSYKKEEQ